MENLQIISGKKIDATDGSKKMFCCLTVSFNEKGKEKIEAIFFYMTRNGQKFESKKEKDTGKLPNMFEWGWAKREWKDEGKPVKVKKLKGSELNLAMSLFSQDIYFSWRDEKVDKILHPQACRAKA